MEKFALLNLLKALEALSPQKKTDDNGVSGDNLKNMPPESKTADAPVLPDSMPINVMSSVLERHEEIANRIRNGSRK